MGRMIDLFVEEGAKKGSEKGWGTGGSKGRVRAQSRADAVLLLLKRRFGKIPADLAETIRRQEREEVLGQLLLEVVAAGNLREFRSKLVQTVAN